MKTTPQNPPPYPPLFNHPGSEHLKAEKKKQYLDSWVRFACAAMSAVGGSDPEGSVLFPDRELLIEYAEDVADKMMYHLEIAEEDYDDHQAEKEEEEAVEKLKNTPPE